MITLFVVFAAAFVVTYLLTPRFISMLVDVGIMGRDKNKEGEPAVAEMGGLSIITGFVFGVLLAIAFSSFEMAGGSAGFKVNLSNLFAALSTVLIMSLLGIFDDIFNLKQHVKAALPLLASLPLVAVKVGETSMNLPFMGTVDFGLLYTLLLIPLAITGASNAMNMLAGFNGLEAGLGVIMCASVGFVSFSLGYFEASVISFSMLGALLAFLRYNWFPAKIFPGDVGTLSVGAVVASSVILGNVEKLGIVLILPFFAELFLKMRGGFKAQSWCGVEGDKLVCRKTGDVYGLGRLVMYLSGGITEKNLVFVLLIVEFVFALVGVSLYF
jgi:UDP-N-acetylglucosamine--dolichyl-phosphate N-acetylglucosaminephosphotransferase